jgi:hypothetical protein
MAKTYALKDRIDAGLRSMPRRLQELPFYEQRFNEAPDSETRVERSALEAEWLDGLHRFESLHEHFVHGEMNPEQAQKHRQNLALLKMYLPILVKLGLAIPSGALAAWLDSSEAAEAMAELI